MKLGSCVSCKQKPFSNQISLRVTRATRKFFVRPSHQDLRQEIYDSNITEIYGALKRVLKSCLPMVLHMNFSSMCINYVVEIIII